MVSGGNSLRYQQLWNRGGRRPRTTTIDDVYALGDLNTGHNQVLIALADGAKTDVSIHFTLQDFPCNPDIDVEADPVRLAGVPGIPDTILEQAVDFHTYD